MPTQIDINDINVAGRSRQHFGNIPALADSIRRLGLLHPVVITPEHKLIAGHRRIEAFKLLGHTTIPCNVAHNVEELHQLLEAERDENSCRENYTPEEAVHLASRFEPIIKSQAAAARHDGAKRGGQLAGKGRPFSLPQSLGKAKRHAGESVRQIGAVVGMSGPTLEKARAVVQSGERTLIDEMNRTGRVSGVHRKLVVAQKSAAIANEPPPLLEGPFRVIVCDPPWRYDCRADDPSHQGSLPYPSMSIAEIAALPVRDRAHDDCVLWLWTTNSHVAESFAIVEAWGFEYKTMLTWVKNKMGTGDWLRGKTEHCLMCVRGKPTIRLTNQTTALVANAGAHSAKPDEFYALVESLCPGSKLEMFQRTPRKGWLGFGDEAKPPDQEPAQDPAAVLGSDTSWP